MEKVHIKGTEVIPEIFLDVNQNKFRISGHSRPENVEELYQKIIDWVNDNEDKITQPLNCEFDFIYFNTPSQKMIYNVMNRLNDLFKDGKEVTISWIYNELDDDMYEMGEQFAEILDVPFEFLPQ